MRTLAAFDSFKGTIPAARACRLALEAFGGDLDPCPLSDGGEGLIEAVGARRSTIRTRDPLGRLQVSVVGFTGSIGLIEVAEVVGLPAAQARGELDPVRATTAGLATAVEFMAASGAASLVIGCGGAATTDGGLGAVVQLLRRGYRRLPLPTTVLFDVRTEFAGAAAEFGPQKGAGPSDVLLLFLRLEAVSRWYRRRFGVDVAALPGSGAAGGLAGGLAAMGAELSPGLGWVAGAVELERRAAQVDRVISGEGRLDAGSFSGKVVGEVVRLAERLHKPCVVIAGSADPEGRALAERHGAEVVSLELEHGRERCLADPEGTLATSLRRIARGSGQERS